MHKLKNTVRGLLGEPDRLDYVSLAEHSVTVMLRFGNLPAAIHWIDLPGIARYTMEFALYAPDRRVTLVRPVPAQRARRAGHQGQLGGGRRAGGAPRRSSPTPAASGPSWVALSTTAPSGAAPVAYLRRDGLRDVALCRAIIESHRTGGPVEDPAGPAGKGPRGRRQNTPARAGIAVANAPVSYGAFESRVAAIAECTDRNAASSTRSAGGLQVIDLEPVDLAAGPRLGELLAERGLGLAGGYLELPYADHDALEPALGELDALLATFDAVRPYLRGRRLGRPWPTPAARSGGASPAGPPASPPSASTPAGGGSSPRAWPTGWWATAATAATSPLPPGDRDLCGGPVGVEEVLDRSDIGLCLETGHMMMGGGDPVAMLETSGEHVDHAEGRRAHRHGRDRRRRHAATDIWSREAFCELGRGDLDVHAILDGLRGISFGGWLVVEQDILPRSAQRFARAAEEQRHNRAFLGATRG